MSHGWVFILLMAAGSAVPALRTWPWVWLAPLLGYAGVVACLPRFRQMPGWLRLGRVDRGGVVATLAVMGLTAGTLVAFHAVMRPEVGELRASIPFAALGGVVTAGLLFCLLNATLEEFVFRGVLFEALESRWGTRFTLAATSLLFGLGHWRGYPSGLTGVVLASLFGVATGWLKWRSGGLLLPILAHIVADAVIYGILFGA